MPIARRLCCGSAFPRSGPPLPTSSGSLLTCRRLRAALDCFVAGGGELGNNQYGLGVRNSNQFQLRRFSDSQQQLAAKASTMGPTSSSASVGLGKTHVPNPKKGVPSSSVPKMEEKCVGTETAPNFVPPIEDGTAFPSSPSSSAEAQVAAAGRAAHRARSAEWRTLVFSSWQRGMFTALGVATGVALLLFLLAAPMKADTVQQTAQIASQALEDQRLKETATKLSKEVVEQILTDPRSVVLLADVVQTLLKQDASKIAVTSFIRDIFEDRYTQEITKKFVLKVVSDPWVMDQLYHILFSLVDDLLKDQDTKDALREVLVTSSIEALKDEDLQAQGGRAVRSIVWQTIWNSKGAPNTTSSGTSTTTDSVSSSPSSSAK